MKNKEKYDLMDIEVKIYTYKTFGEIYIMHKGKVLASYSDEDYKADGMFSCFQEWLESEYKEPIKLTDDEKVILRNLDKKHKWIARDKNGWLYVYKGRPLKAYTSWHNNYSGGMPMVLFNHLFQFIKWEDEEPYSIEELLKDE